MILLAGIVHRKDGGSFVVRLAPQINFGRG